MAKRKTTITKKRGDTIKLVVKSNKLVEAKYMFNIWETRFFLTLVTMISKDDADDKVYRIWYKDVKSNFNINSNKSYYFLREAARSIHSKTVEIGWMDGEVSRGRAYRLFKFVDYLKDEQKKGLNVQRHEYVDVKIDEEMLPFLLHVKKQFDQKKDTGEKYISYTSYDLRNIEKLKTYAIRMYELLKQFEFKGFRTISVDALRDMFLITDEYPRFSTFNQSVIMPSIRAINKETDLYIPIDRITKIKRGRKIDALRFVIESKSEDQLAEIRGKKKRPSSSTKKVKRQEDPNELKPEKQKEEAIKGNNKLFIEFEEIVVQSFGVTPSVFLKMLNSGKYSKEVIKQAISVTRRAKYNQDIKKSVSGFFIKALKEGFTDVKEEANKAAKRKKENKSRVQILAEEVTALENAMIKRINNRIRDVINENPFATAEAIETLKQDPKGIAQIKELERKLDRCLEIEDFRQDKVLRKMVINHIVELNKPHFADILSEHQPKIEVLKQAMKVLY